MKRKRAFTMVELLIIVAIVGILATVILVTWAISAQNKAAISSYKTSMESVRTAAEMCQVSGGQIRSFVRAEDTDSNVCLPSTDSKYPALPAKCGPAPYFYGYNDQGRWHITTCAEIVGPICTAWDCRGCRLDCSTEKCEEAPGTKCD